MIVVLLLVSVMVFAMTHLLPGNAARIDLGQDGTPAQIKSMTRSLGLDEPFWTQYGKWLGQLVRGNLGTSFSFHVPVASLVGTPLLNSGFLVVVAMLLSLPLAVVLGTAAAARRGGLFDSAFQSVVVLANALPMYVIATVLVTIFATNVTHLLPAVSNVTPGSYPWDHLSSVVLPVATLVILGVSYIGSIVRTTMIDALQSEYVMFATLRGVSRRRILFRHALGNALGPILQVTSIATALSFGSVVIVEYVFDYPGIGTGLNNAIASRDLPVIQAYVLVIGVVFFLSNVAADTLRRAFGGDR